jgi:PAS domain S-box-containing protein
MTNNNLSEDALRKAQKDILLQNEKLKAIFACTPDAIIIIDSNINITDCNEKCLDLFCYSREEIIGKNCMILVAEKDRDRAIVDSKKVLFENVTTSDEYTGVKSNGEEFVSEASTSVLKDASGRPIGIVVAIRDATERKKESRRANSFTKQRCTASSGRHRSF